MRRLVVVQLAMFAVIAAVVIPFGIRFVAGPAGLMPPMTLHATLEPLKPIEATDWAEIERGVVQRAALLLRAKNAQLAKVSVFAFRQRAI